MIGVGVERGLRHDRSRAGLLQHQPRPVTLVADQLDRTSLDDMQGLDGVARMEQEASFLKDNPLVSNIVQVAFDRAVHDKYHAAPRRRMARGVNPMEVMMPRAIPLLFALLFPAFGSAQTMPNHHPGGMPSAPMGHPPMEHRPMTAIPTQPGQGAFAAIQEIVQILEADPATDWSKVNIEALRQHLIDMDNVTLHAEVKTEPVDGGMMFVVSGTGPVRDSIQRMVTAHAATMSGVAGWHFVAETTATGATLTVKTPAADRDKLTGLGLIGVLAEGMHHQMHHLMIARGGMPHH